MLIVTLLTLVVLATAEAIPPSASMSSGNRPVPDGSCSFALWQRQQSSSNYIQLNTIWDLVNDITVDVAAQRPATGFNSYNRLDNNHAFAVTGLLDDKELIVTKLWGDELAFRVGEMEWSTQSFWRRKDPSGKWKRAACSAGAWEDSAEARERRLSCFFPCGKLADQDWLPDPEGVGAEEAGAEVNMEL